LFGGLGGNPPEIGRRDLDLNGFAELDIRRTALRVGKSDLIVFVDDVLDNQQLGERADIAGFAVNFDTHVLGGADSLLRCLKNGLLNRLKQGLLVETLLALQVFQDRYQFAVHIRCLVVQLFSCSLRTPLSGNKKAGTQTHLIVAASNFRGGL